ncbi:SDR family NAD(P)-dependent oxidoreductase [Actinomadura kijaniata]|uniref:SDR family NAD(P)-dependent oxidoreductase n=1 Tax=Actinomadura kijaniata TaxID=46161 RepID=UPI003F1D870B
MTRTALVTGAGSGLGALAARRLAAAAWDVVAVDVDADGLAATARRSPNLHTRVCDVTDPDAVARVVAESGAVHRVVHAAAISPLGAALEQPLAEVERVLRVDFLGAVVVARATLPGMLARGRGELVVFSSLGAWVPGHLTSAYASAKAAVNAFVEALAVEHRGGGVTFRCVCPRQVDTPMYRAVAARHPAATGGAKGMPPGRVLDAVERSLARPEDDLYVFPDALTRATVTAKRLLPRATRRAIAGRTDPRRS